MKVKTLVLATDPDCYEHTSKSWYPCSVKWKQMHHKCNSEVQRSHQFHARLWCQSSHQTRFIELWLFLDTRKESSKQNKGKYSHLIPKLQLEYLIHGQTGEDVLSHRHLSWLWFYWWSWNKETYKNCVKGEVNKIASSLEDKIHWRSGQPLWNL